MASNDNTEANEHTGVDAEAYITNGLNLLLDQFKHLTTLSAGSLILIATFLSDIFPRSDNGDLTMSIGLKLFIAASFALLGISLISSVFFMLHFANKITSRNPSQRVKTFLNSGLATVLQAVSLLSFLAGIILFGVAVLINLFY